MEEIENFEEVRQTFITSKRKLLEMLDLAFDFGYITQKEKEIFYWHLIGQKTLEAIGDMYHITRERIRQIEAKVGEVLRELTKKQNEKK